MNQNPKNPTFILWSQTFGHHRTVEIVSGDIITVM